MMNNDDESGKKEDEEGEAGGVKATIRHTSTSHHSRPLNMSFTVFCEVVKGNPSGIAGDAFVGAGADDAQHGEEKVPHESLGVTL